MQSFRFIFPYNDPIQQQFIKEGVHVWGNYRF
jgi:hypothetical protein